MPTITTPAPAASRKVEALAEQLVDLERQLADLSEQAEIVRKRLIATIGLGNSVETETARLTVYNTTTNTVDFEALTSLKPGWARRVTRRSLDQAKFTHMFKAAQVPADVLAIVKTTVSAQSLRVTRR